MLTKEQVSESMKNKEKKNESFWTGINLWVLIVAGVLIFFGWRSMQLDKEGGSSYFFLVLIVVAILFIMSKQTKEVSHIPDPKEALMLVERECERVKRWNEDYAMKKYDVGPIYDILHKDARGKYYDVAVKWTDPFGPIEYMIGKVMMYGDESRFVTLIQSNGPLTGKEIHQEKDITKVPFALSNANKFPVLERLWGLK